MPHFASIDTELHGQTNVDTGQGLYSYRNTFAKSRGYLTTCSFTSLQAVSFASQYWYQIACAKFTLLAVGAFFSPFCLCGHSHTLSPPHHSESARIESLGVRVTSPWRPTKPNSLGLYESRVNSSTSSSARSMAAWCSAFAISVSPSAPSLRSNPMARSTFPSPSTARLACRESAKLPGRKKTAKRAA